MFEVGFSELLLLALVTLLVVGPERLPAVARAAGKWIGRMKALANSIRSEIDKELQAEELKQIARRVAEPLEGLASEVKESLTDSGRSDSGPGQQSSGQK